MTKWDLNKKIAWKKKYPDWHQAAQEALDIFGRPQTLLDLIKMDDYIIKQIDLDQYKNNQAWELVMGSLICSIEGFTPEQYHTLYPRGRQGEKGDTGQMGVAGRDGKCICN